MESRNQSRICSLCEELWREPMDIPYSCCRGNGTMNVICWKKKKKRKPTPCIAVDLCVFPTFYAIPSLSLTLAAFPLFTCIRPALFDRPILHSPTPIPIISRSFKRAPMTAIDVLTSIRVKKYICAISVD